MAAAGVFTTLPLLSIRRVKVYLAIGFEWWLLQEWLPPSLSQLHLSQAMSSLEERSTTVGFISEEASLCGIGAVKLFPHEDGAPQGMMDRNTS